MDEDLSMGPRMINEREVVLRGIERQFPHPQIQECCNLL
jgi:hypothetical protein